ncbi:hypothetical protein LOTGIDRAFT_118005, partial [Lottia gigantea]
SSCSDHLIPTNIRYIAHPVQIKHGSSCSDRLTPTNTSNIAHHVQIAHHIQIV